MARSAELVDLVDVRDRKVGAAPLASCLRRGLLHRAVAVLVFRPDGALVIQRRSKGDAWHPGRLTLSCTGHVRAGESFLAAARRELSEELGLSARLSRRDKVLLPKVRSGGRTEWEMATVYSCVTSAPLAIDRGELEGVIVVPRRRLPALLGKRSLTPDARLLLSRHLKSVRHDSRSRGAA